MTVTEPIQDQDGVVEDIDRALAALPTATLMAVDQVQDILLDLRAKAERN